jgi:hypothetical protein
VELARALKERWAAALYRAAIDPDGRPLPLRRNTALYRAVGVERV